MPTFLRTNARSRTEFPQNISGINHASPLSRDLLAAWVPNGTQNVLNLVDGVPLEGSWGNTATEHGRAFNFDGTSQNAYATIPIGSAGLTLSCWYMRNPTQAIFYDNVMGLSESDNDLIVIAIDNNRVFGAPVRRLGNWEGAGASGVNTSAAPVHLCLTIDDLNAGTVKFYVNGEVKGSNSLAQDYRNFTSNFGLGWGGAGRGTSRRCPGTIVSPLVHGRGLSAAEVLMLYEPQTRWDVYDTYQRTYYIPASTPPPSTSVPIYLYHHRHRNRAA